MATHKRPALKLLPGEDEWLTEVVYRLAEDSVKLVYADWLDEKGDSRGDFLRLYVRWAQSLDSYEFLPDDGLPKEWLELIGYRLLWEVAEAEQLQLKEAVLKVARPALRMKKAPAADKKIAVGASKIGGLPDLPPGYAWPPGGDCHAIYNDDTGGTDRLAGFLAQINLAEIAGTQAARGLPKAGLLSFFCFQDIENDNPDAIGAMAVFFPDVSGLVRTEPPKALTEGNTVIDPERLTFEETLDLPGPDSPWEEDLKAGPDADYDAIYEDRRDLNFHNVLGYARSTTGNDPTPSKRSRHLIVLNNAVGCRLHIQIDQDDLAAAKFDKITLNWVDFD